MDKIEYRKIHDAKILGEIHASSWKEAYKGIVPDEILNQITPDKREKYFEKALTEGSERDAILYKESKATGLSCIGKCRDKDRNEDHGEIWGIYLKPEYWNQGIGYELMTWGIEELKNQGYSKATLWVLEESCSKAFL